MFISVKTIAKLNPEHSNNFEIKIQKFSRRGTCTFSRQRRQDKTRQPYYILAHDTVMTDLASQVAEANQGGPGTIKINEIY